MPLTLVPRPDIHTPTGRVGVYVLARPMKVAKRVKDIIAVVNITAEHFLKRPKIPTSCAMKHDARCDQETKFFENTRSIQGVSPYLHNVDSHFKDVATKIGWNRVEGERCLNKVEGTF